MSAEQFTIDELLAEAGWTERLARDAAGAHEDRGRHSRRFELQNEVVVSETVILVKLHGFRGSLYCLRADVA